MDENYTNDFEFGWANQTPAAVFPEEPAEAGPPEEPTPIEAPIPAPAPPAIEEPIPPRQNSYGQPAPPQVPQNVPQQPPPQVPAWQGGYAQQSWQPQPPVQPVPPQPQPWQGGYHTQAWGPAAQPPVQPPPKRKKTGTVIFAIFLVLLIGAGTAVGVKIYRSPGEKPGSSTTESSTEAPLDNAEMTLVPPPGGLASNAGGALSAEDIHEKLKHSNVLIQVYGSRDAVAGEGSGILLMEDDTGTYTYVVTCAHVIKDQSKVSVELENGESYDAIVVATDTRTDIGLLKIMKTGLECAEFGDSSALRVGATVYALGNPGGAEFKSSFTPGMVSAIDRPIQSSSYKQILIQHTAPINPGNSGGMLVNAAGQVIGINSLKIVDYQYEGMGFAIPSKVVKEIVDDLIKYGRVPNRPKLGISYAQASSSQLGYYVVRMRDLPSGSLIIAKIDPDSGFQGTDVQPNDIITHVNGKPLTKPDVLLSAIENSNVGDTLKLTIVRVSRTYEVNEFEVSVKLVEDKGAAEESTTEPPNLDFFDQYGW